MRGKNTGHNHVGANITQCYNSVVIDWVQSLFHFVWVTGLAILAGQFSFVSWQNSIEPATSANMEKTITIIGTLMTGLGFAIVSSTVAQRVAWLVVTIALIILTYRDLEKKPPSSEYKNNGFS